FMVRTVSDSPHNNRRQHPGRNHGPVKNRIHSDRGHGGGPRRGRLHRRYVRGLLIVSTTTTAAAPGTGITLDPGAAWRLNPLVAVRPEPFGALLYHFGTRRLSFLKDTRLVDLVTALGDFP